MNVVRSKVKEDKKDEYMKKLKEFFDNIANAPIIDIRLEEEWLETGILKNSYTITFFDEMGQYNLEEFLQKINKILNFEKNKKFFHRLFYEGNIQDKY